MERGRGGEKPLLGFIGERACEAESPKRATAPARVKNLGGDKGNGFFGGRKSLERRCKARKFCSKAQERKR